MDESLKMLLEQDGYAQVLIELSVDAASGIAAAEAAAVDLAPNFLDRDAINDRTESGTIMTSNIGAGLAAQTPVRLERSARGQVGDRPNLRVFPNLGLALGYVDRNGATALSDNPAVARMLRAETPSLVRPVQVQQVAATAGISWGIAQMGVPELWAQNFRGRGVLVGHIDTGIDGSHPALQGAVADFTEFDLNGDEVKGTVARDSDEHGTHTAGTIAGRPGSHGSFGVAPEAKLLSAMVIEGGDVLGRILGGIEWSLNGGAQIINASLGIRGQGDFFQTLVRRLRERNVLPVFAVGNEGPGTSRFPGNYANVLSVGACDIADAVAGFSGSQRFPDRTVPDLVAPGVDVLSCIPNGQFASMNGSSMATPHIAGLAALLLSAVPSASADDVEAAIQDSCTLRGNMVAQRAGRGLPNAPRALNLLQTRLQIV
jgi:subtilisin